MVCICKVDLNLKKTVLNLKNGFKSVKDGFESRKMVLNLKRMVWIWKDSLNLKRWFVYVKMVCICTDGLYM